jgi:MFS family permease
MRLPTQPGRAGQVSEAMSLTTDLSVELKAPGAGDARRGSRIYYGWVCVAAAALAMVATLPGRTIGLGLATEPLIRDLGLSRASYGTINLWATLIGAGFGLAGGRLLDRVGARGVLAGVALLLGLVVLGMTRVAGSWGLFAGVTLTRGLGQSALSGASIAVVGKWFDRRIGYAMAAYSVLLSIGFMIAIPSLDAATRHAGWRAAWGGMGVVLAVVLAPLFWMIVRSSPETVGLTIDGARGAPDNRSEPVTGYTLGEALATPAFWALALGGFVFNAAYSGITLFNESILAERGFRASPAGPLIVIVFTALAANFLAGWLASRWSVTKLMGIAICLSAGSLVVLPLVRTRAQVYLYAGAMGVSAGMVTVVFFACWSKLYGRRHLGRIQGAAQAVTVLASAAGPVALAECLERYGSYAPAFYGCAALAAALGTFCLIVREPGKPAGFDLCPKDPLRSAATSASPT